MIIDGHTLNESVAICEYLEETRKENPLMPSCPFKKSQVRTLMEIVNSGIQPLQNVSVLNMVEVEYKGDRKKWAQAWISKGIKGKIILI